MTLAATSPAATEERRLALTRVEHAAGAAFGCEDEAVPARGRRLTAPTALALATLATALAATITYLV